MRLVTMRQVLAEMAVLDPDREAKRAHIEYRARLSIAELCLCPACRYEEDIDDDDYGSDHDPARLDD